MQEIIWNKEQIEKATKGIATKDFAATGLEFDSRLVTKGDLFIAFKGEHTDGHNFLDQAFANGACAAIVDQDVTSEYPLIKVDSTFDAIQQMAKYKRELVPAKYIAITGSIGKTTTKELTFSALKEIGNTHCSKANNNNILGLSINLARMPNNTEFAIYELGMDKPGELAELSNFLEPQIAVITRVEGVHRAQFNSLDEIAKAKAEIFEGLTIDGVVILNKDNVYYNFLAEEAKSNGITQILSFGEDDKADAKLSSYDFDNNIVKASIQGTEVTYKLAMCGKHHALNSLAALCAFIPLNIDLQKAANGFINTTPSLGRGGIKHIKYNGKDVTLIDDSYNAHPVSMTAAIQNLAKKKHTGRKIAVLADMLELGPEEEKLHTNMNQVIENTDLSGVITVGKLMKNLNKTLADKLNIAHFNNVDDLKNELDQYIQNNDMILLKGSKGTNLHKLAKLMVTS
jgi:UDP-N-acetylmuramoyl-tripeptide--D-alanyl-D-alanine ligase